MAAATHNFIAEQGVTFNETLTYLAPDGVTPIDLTGMTGRMQVRDSYGASTPILDLTTANGGIILGGVLGTVQILIAASVMSALTVPDIGSDHPTLFGYYDIELVNGLVVTRLVQGTFNITREITR